MPKTTSKKSYLQVEKCYLCKDPKTPATTYIKPKNVKVAHILKFYTEDLRLPDNAIICKRCHLSAHKHFRNNTIPLRWQKEKSNHQWECSIEGCSRETSRAFAGTHELLQLLECFGQENIPHDNHGLSLCSKHNLLFCKHTTQVECATCG